MLSTIFGVTLGLLSGYLGGKTDAVIMRICDVMLSFPAILQDPVHARPHAAQRAT